MSELILSASNKQTILTATDKALEYIIHSQLDSGAIPWFTKHKLDPWDHTEALMALAVKGYQAEWHRAFDWLSANQNPDGSWFSHYLCSENENSTKIETNFVAYPATGLWHYHLCYKDKAVLKKHFPSIKAAINYILKYQSPEGDIQWAIEANSSESLPKDALVTACSSILRSLECAISISETLDYACTSWRAAYLALKDTLQNKPWRFDRTWESKERFSMDWFYPILAGIYSPQEARIRLQKKWFNFIEPEIGCRCVSNEPWMTVAESCELCLALISSNQHAKASEILVSLTQWQDKDGGFWTGYNFRDKNIWPLEKTTWTAAAFILASDALLGLSPASRLFTQPGSID